MPLKMQPNAAEQVAVSLTGDLTIAAALAAMSRAFADAGLEEPTREARFLLKGLLEVDGSWLLTHSDQKLGEAIDRVRDAVRRRVAREPVSRILGRREFYGRTFVITTDVLDPRPDTEAVVDLALEIVRAHDLQNSEISIADIGTGSGILISTLMAELPNANGTATDVSTAALAVARENAERLGVAERITFVATRSLDRCPGPFHLIVSNPPYIPTSELAGLEADVREYDPRMALDGGPDGLGIYREIAVSVGKTLRAPDRPTWIILEVGAGQAASVKQIFEDLGWCPMADRKDLGGYMRAVALEIQC